ncbi:MAG: hypothetical protein NC124_14920, partial [Clostridium sp.]|nr:hypothetical protein [Clostridium sp.]
YIIPTFTLHNITSHPSLHNSKSAILPLSACIAKMDSPFKQSLYITPFSENVSSVSGVEMSKTHDYQNPVVKT